MRKHIAKRRVFAHRLSPIGITSPQREVDDRLYTTAPVPILAQPPSFVNFRPTGRFFYSCAVHPAA